MFVQTSHIPLIWVFVQLRTPPGSFLLIPFQVVWVLELVLVEGYWETTPFHHQPAGRLQTTNWRAAEPTWLPGIKGRLFLGCQTFFWNVLGCFWDVFSGINNFLTIMGLELVSAKASEAGEGESHSGLRQWCLDVGGKASHAKVGCVLFFGGPTKIADVLWILFKKTPNWAPSKQTRPF